MNTSRLDLDLYHNPIPDHFNYKIFLKFLQTCNIMGVSPTNVLSVHSLFSFWMQKQNGIQSQRRCKKMCNSEVNAALTHHDAWNFRHQLSKHFHFSLTLNYIEKAIVKKYSFYNSVQAFSLCFSALGNITLRIIQEKHFCEILPGYI